MFGIAELPGRRTFMSRRTCRGGAAPTSCASRSSPSPGSGRSGDRTTGRTNRRSRNPGCSGSRGCTVDRTNPRSRSSGSTNYNTATGRCTDRGSGGPGFSSGGALAGGSASTIPFLSAADKAEHYEYNYERGYRFHFLVLSIG